MCVAVRTAYGHAALGRFYDALWAGVDGGRREWIGDIAEALSAAGLPAALAAAGFATDHYVALPVGLVWCTVCDERMGFEGGGDVCRRPGCGSSVTGLSG